MTQKDTDDGAVAAGPWLIRRRSGYQMTEIRSTTGLISKAQAAAGGGGKNRNKKLRATLRTTVLPKPW